jgi:two-component system, OmpR family, copper resistance phosphate regulon response regulator CusR
MDKLEIRILVVEDEPKVASYLKLGLEESGYMVDIAPDGMAGKRMFKKGIYNLVILDIILPYLSGLELCRKIRKSDTNIPILMLTALGSTHDKLSGFDTGADDYLVKPFEFSELLARIKSLLKRTTPSGKTSKILKYNDLELNFETFEATRRDKKIDLTHKEFALLEHLIKNSERVVTRNEIADKVWDINFNTGTNIIDVYINFLRKKIDKDFKIKLIHTVPGFGYILKTEENET